MLRILQWTVAYLGQYRCEAEYRWLCVRASYFILQRIIYFLHCYFETYPSFPLHPRTNSRKENNQLVTHCTLVEKKLSFYFVQKYHPSMVLVIFWHHEKWIMQYNCIFGGRHGCFFFAFCLLIIYLSQLTATIPDKASRILYFHNVGPILQPSPSHPLSLLMKAKTKYSRVSFILKQLLTILLYNSWSEVAGKK